MLVQIQTRNNLYDTVLNEIEKIFEYERVLRKFSTEDMIDLTKTNFDVDMIGFIQVKNDDIITDKLLRSFINIKQAMNRACQSTKVELSSPDTTIVTYSQKVIDRVYSAIDEITKIRTKKKLYDTEYNKELINTSFNNWCKRAEDEFEKFVQECESSDEDLITVATEQFVPYVEESFDKIHTFLMIMMGELESHPYLKNSSIIMKHVYYVAIIVSITIMNISIS